MLSNVPGAKFKTNTRYCILAVQKIKMIVTMDTSIDGTDQI